MDAEAAIDLCRQSLLAALMLAAPILLVGMAVGLAVGLLQALTQIQDQTVAFVPKLVAMSAVTIACLPWLMGRLVELAHQIFTSAAIP